MIDTRLAPANEKDTRLSYLDGLRGLACLMVYFYHYASNLGAKPWVIYGFTGVHLFFILSGYLLYQPFLKALLADRPLPKTRDFYVRRFVRIYPPYFVALIVYFALRVVAHTHVPTRINVGAHALLIFNYFDPAFWYSINPVFWSLAIEAQFYLVLPLIVALVRRCLPGDGKRTAFAIPLVFFAVGVLTRAAESVYWVGHTDAGAASIMFRSVFAYLDLFAPGMLIAVLSNKLFRDAARSRVSFANALIVGLLLLCVGNYYFSVGGGSDWIGNPSVPFAILFPVLICAGWGGLLLAFSLFENRSPVVFNRGFFPWMGSISYSFYLYHLGIQQFLLKYLHLEGKSPNWHLMMLCEALICLPATLLLSTIMFYLVEKPCLNWLAQPRHRKSAAVVLTDAAGS